MKDLHLKPGSAKVRISEAVSNGHIRTNGLRGAGLRLNLDSLNTLRIQLRESQLDKSDERTDRNLAKTSGRRERVDRLAHADSRGVTPRNTAQSDEIR